MHLARTLAILAIVVPPVAGGTLASANSTTISNPTIIASFDCTTLVPTIIGTAGSDVLMGTDGDDVIFGLDGDDTMWGHGGNDVICAGAGDELIAGEAGRDFLNGGRGRDTVGYGNSPAGVSVNLVERFGKAADGHDRLLAVENVVGSQFDDRIVGNDRPNALTGLGGVDTIAGLGGVDSCTGEFEFTCEI